MALSQKARETIDQRLVTNGWVLQDGDAAEPEIARGVAVRKYPLAVSILHGDADYALYVNGELRAMILDLNHAQEPDNEALMAVSLDDLTIDDEEELEDTAPLEPASIDRPSLLRYYVTYQEEEKNLEIVCEGLYLLEHSQRQCYDFHSPVALEAHQHNGPMPLDERPSDFDESPNPPGIYWALSHLPPTDDRILWPGQSAAVSFIETSIRGGAARRAWMSMPHGSGVTFMLTALAWRLASAGNAVRIVVICKSVQTVYLAQQSFEDFGSLVESHKAQVLATETADPDNPRAPAHPIHASLWLDAELPDPTAQVLFCTADVFADTTGLSWNAFSLVLCDDPLPQQLDRLVPALQLLDCEQYLVASGPIGETAIRWWGEESFRYTSDQVVLDGALVPSRIYCLNAFREGDDVTIHAEFGSCGDGEVVSKFRPDEDYISEPEFARAFQMKDAQDENLPRLKSGTDEVDFALLQSFREKLFNDLFPDRLECPKTIIFARDVDHARAVAGLVEEVFRREEGFSIGAGYETGDAPVCDATFKAGEDGDLPLYKSNGTADRRVDREIQCFLTGVMPRILVCPVDSPLIHQNLAVAEVTLLLWPVDSRAQLYSMISRGSFNLRKTVLHRVSPDVPGQCGKSIHVIVDAAGMAEEIFDAPASPMDMLPRESLGHLLQEVAFGTATDHVLRSLASRLLTLDARLFPEEKEKISKLASGATPHTLAQRLLQAVDPARQREYAIRHRLNADSERTLLQTRNQLVQQATRNITTSIELRNVLTQFFKDATARKARSDNFYGADTEPPVSVVPEGSNPEIEQ